MSLNDTRYFAVQKGAADPQGVGSQKTNGKINSKNKTNLNLMKFKR